MKAGRNRGHPGQDLIEYALLLPFMIILVMAIFDLGRVTFYFSGLTNATREAARYGSVQDHACDTNALTNLVNERTIGMQSVAITVTWVNATGSAPNCKPGFPGTAKVKVRAVYCFTPVTPFVSRFIGAGGGGGCASGTLPLNSETTMYLEM